MRLDSARFPEDISQSIGVPIEVGTQQPSSPAPTTRIQAGGLPDVVRPSTQRLTTNRSDGGTYRPALPSDVVRPEVALPAEPAASPAAASLANSSGPEPRRTMAAAPDVAPAATPPGLPQADFPLGPARTPRVQVAESLPAPQSPPAASAERTTTLDVRPPVEDVAIPAAPRDAAVVPSTPPAAATAIDPGPIADPSMLPQPVRPAGDSGPEAELAEVRVVPSATPDEGPANNAGSELPQVTDVARRPTNSISPPTRRALPMVRDTPTDVAPRASARQSASTQIQAVGPASVAVTEPMSRTTPGALPVEVEAGPGVGGLSSDVSTDIGLLHRQAQPDSDQVVDSVGRFLRRPVGGPLSLDSHVPIPARAYETRMNRQGQRPAGGNGRPSPRTEEAIELGLVYLAEHQREDGSWSLTQAGESAAVVREKPITIHSDAAATGLSLLAFLGAGYHHRADKYGDVVRDGLQYLLTHQQPNGDLFVRGDLESNRSAWLYSHAIASIALCEAFGMTQDPELREPAQRAVDFIVQAQHPQRGGWRYAPGVGSDTSVSGWMVMALRSAELANLHVPVDTWQRVDVWLEMAKASEECPELYRYNPLAPNTLSQGHGRRPTKTITAVGLLMRLYTGWRRDDLQMIAGADYLMNNLPAIGSLRDPQRDTYYWYYATQVMFHMRGPYWERWNAELHELLTSTQLQIGELAGSWDPWAPLPDRWAPHAGRLYVTTMNLLSLEVYYRHLPIYEDTSR